MQSGIYFVAVLFLGSALGLSPFTTNRGYRSDYTYLDNTRAYYKVHSALTDYNTAKAICNMEGGQLMITSSIEEERKEEIDMVQKAIVRGSGEDHRNYIWVGDKTDDTGNESTGDEATGDDEIQLPSGNVASNFPHLGRIDENSDPNGGSIVVKLHVTIPGPSQKRKRRSVSSDSDSSCAVITTDNVIEKYDCDKKLPFVCKVEAKDALYDEKCGVYGTGYKYLEEVRNCYRVPEVAYKWDDARNECNAEGAKLIVLESEQEAQAVQKFLQTAPKIHLLLQNKYYYFAGIVHSGSPEFEKKEGPARFITLFSQSLDKAGYNQWSPGEPNNYENYEDCGAISANDGKYNDVSCHTGYAFICKSKAVVH